MQDYPSKEDLNGPPAKSYKTIWPWSVVVFGLLFLSAFPLFGVKGQGGEGGIIYTPEHILAFKTHTDTLFPAQ